MTKTEDPDCFAVIVESRQVLARDTGSVITSEGERMWVVEDEWGDTSRNVRFEPGVPDDVWTFETENSARSYAMTWKGHPWYCQPNGSYEIVPLTKKYVHKGYERRK